MEILPNSIPRIASDLSDRTWQQKGVISECLPREDSTAELCALDVLKDDEPVHSVCLPREDSTAELCALNVLEDDSDDDLSIERYGNQLKQSQARTWTDVPFVEIEAGEDATDDYVLVDYLSSDSSEALNSPNMSSSPRSRNNSSNSLNNEDDDLMKHFQQVAIVDDNPLVRPSSMHNISSAISGNVHRQMLNHPVGFRRPQSCTSLHGAVNQVGDLFKTQCSIPAPAAVGNISHSVGYTSNCRGCHPLHSSPCCISGGMRRAMSTPYILAHQAPPVSGHGCISSTAWGSTGSLQQLNTCQSSACCAQASTSMGVPNMVFRMSPGSLLQQHAPTQVSPQMLAAMAAARGQVHGSQVSAEAMDMQQTLLAAQMHQVQMNNTPQVRPTPSTNGDGFLYQVQFKRCVRSFLGSPTLTNQPVMPGDYVRVEADRGHDLGKVIAKAPFMGSNPPTPVTAGHNLRYGLDKEKVLRAATEQEISQMHEKMADEERVLEVCRSKIKQRDLPMRICDAEYQFDRHKLTFFFEAEGRVDFRELVRDLFAIYKTRIWMQQIEPSARLAAPMC
eukprot:CAMPEP_0113941976 /NCGR_PEP_ID=MMETSP1339-20121228/7782_1 /TAXON_ID=94617 /ORGANISM="Fibrocapsa japonica" /LENGTH=560 /DNA_ID=CAMNT_0000946277 /DNA_START=65 /DNA_END=1747 /DNA_ORIENTATION=+ /assembly_acc=CAM_ASM_000762